MFSDNETLCGKHIGIVNRQLKCHRLMQEFCILDYLYLIYKVKDYGMTSNYVLEILDIEHCFRYNMYFNLLDFDINDNICEFDVLYDPQIDETDIFISKKEKMIVFSEYELVIILACAKSVTSNKDNSFKSAFVLKIVAYDRTKHDLYNALYICRNMFLGTDSWRINEILNDNKYSFLFK